MYHPAVDINIAVRFYIDPPVLDLLQQLVNQGDDRAKAKDLTAAVQKSTAALKNALSSTPTA